MDDRANICQCKKNKNKKLFSYYITVKLESFGLFMLTSSPKVCLEPNPTMGKRVRNSNTQDKGLT